jgi:hypothetical protein
MSPFVGGCVKSSAGKARKACGVRRTCVYAATTKDAAQRSIRAFYAAVIIVLTYPGAKRSLSINNVIDITDNS